MIYLIEGVLPESYFANNLRGLSVDMAVFRDLLRLRLPQLSRHLEHLQMDAGDNTGNEWPLHVLRAPGRGRQGLATPRHAPFMSFMYG